MRAPNGYGTVYKLSGKRRRPWVVRVTVGYTPNKNGGLSPKVKYIGYYTTQKEAFAARDEYNKTKQPGYVPTFIELADIFEQEHFPTIKEQTQRSYRAARGKCSTIAFKAVSDITYTDLQEVVNAAKPSTQAILRVYLNLVFKEALRREYIDRNPAELLKVAKTEKSTIHYRFTSAEIRKLWTVADTPAGAFALLTIYTGARPSELLAAELTGDCLKVASGKTANASRLIPVHEDAKDLLKFFPFPWATYSAVLAPYKAALTSAGVLFYTNPETGKQATHKPHDGRHTFATLWHEQRLNEGIRRYIQGHAQQGVGEQVYTHYDIDVIREELNRLKV